MTVDRDARGRARSAYADLALGRVVRQIAEYAKPDDPPTVTQRRFDRARAAAGHPDCPSARQIVTRLNRALAAERRTRTANDPERAHPPNIAVLTWEEIVQASFGDEAAWQAKVSMGARPAPSDRLDERAISYALRLALALLRERREEPDLDSVGAAEYELMRWLLIDHDRQFRSHGGRLERQMATRKQIVLWAVRGFKAADAGRNEQEKVHDEAGAWNRALQHVGLAPYETRQGVNTRGRTYQQLIDEFIDLNDWAPTAPTIGEYARRSGVKLERARRPFAEDLKKALQARATAGKPPPSKPRPTGREARLRFLVPQGSAPVKRTIKWSRDACVRALAEWDTELPSTVPRTQLTYQAAMKPSWPPMRNFTQYGGFTVLRDEALRRSDARAA